MSKDLEQRSIGIAMRSAFDEEQVRLIRATVASKATPAELALFLELSKRYELDPFAGQIYFTKMPGADGGEGRPAIIVGRDGFLTIANRSPDFEGFDSDTVRENDEFRVERDKNGRPKVTHTYEGGEAKRGKIEGAWCIVYRTGRRPRYFFAHYSEYVPKNEKKLKYSPWSGQPSVMIEKCAISTALRLAFNISGLIGEEEASQYLERSGDAIDTFEYAEDPKLAAQLAERFSVLAELQPEAYRPTKIRLMVRGKSEEDKVVLAEELAQAIEEAGGKVPEEPVEAEAVEEPQPSEGVSFEDDVDEQEALVVE